ncbi:yxjL-like transcriptional regulatory protein [Actinoplanes sp. SE50]|uniref:response regulator transcription factor n=1 Tax=unclassified Actinoplanes TaxID=2626549 RepID=UPI00023ED2DB|nr:MULTISPECIES: LuxR C-terminal-related transcriptional regulator [unclassified Actinoplanes]AEV86709.1 yxjL-like uncharacterized transcriptional regulatory protein [Actinoplanes sp. SE50/110]ATO85107.1 yxjL-like transcriptional regulatory protein [Actinoplanes sp. SE50]SLM02518.1 LuxR-family transcriptional regulator [Actinoplanes sp. SE50/110]
MTAPAAARPLTPRQQETLRYIAAGHTNTDTAKLMGVGITTIKANIKAILARLGARNAANAVYLAFKTGELT